ncbi:eukaryotic translation initiation factor 3G2 [Striga asiatica]|uniref:Eukaryotic translation initiation factor 3G2 n=1 Tax=Striga asiatica TaxID=4170 RepID=A0A5A7PK97_STRAF|nr:eukaryotic translation initiation factor 3G2 [Striga asiatica]
MVGHIERVCSQRIQDVKNHSLREGQFGEWMRAGEGLQSQNWNMAGSSSEQEKDQPSSRSNGNNAIADNEIIARNSNGGSNKSSFKEPTHEGARSSSSKLVPGQSSDNMERDLILFEDQNLRQKQVIVDEELVSGKALEERLNSGEGNIKVTTNVMAKRTLPASLVGKRTWKRNTQKEGRLLRSIAESSMEEDHHMSKRGWENTEGI